MSQHEHIIPQLTMSTLLCDVDNEVRKAERKFPLWPDDPIHGAAVMAEEAGEAVQAALNMVYGKGIEITTERRCLYRKELLHTAATCIRALADLERQP